MKRDMDLAREILFRIEADTHWPADVDLRFEDLCDEVVGYHVMLLKEAGLIEAEELNSQELVYDSVRLTWTGHEFLNAARDDGRWDMAKKALEGAGGFVFDVAKALLVELFKAQIPKPIN